MKKTLVIAALTFALVVVAPAAFAATASSTLTVQASVAAKCTITAAATLNFGTYDPVVANAVAPLDNSVDLAVTCTKGFVPNITAPAGGTITGPGGTLNYSLFSDSGHNNSFVSPGFNMPASSGASSPQTLTIYGRIPGAQDVGVGAYSGTTTITVNF